MTETDRAILDFEAAASWWKYAGAKEQAIRERFDLSPTRYYQRLVRLLDDPEAEAYDAMTVRRLRRLSAARQSARGA